jgi:Galactose oxidase, central domain
MTACRAFSIVSTLLTGVGLSLSAVLVASATAGPERQSHVSIFDPVRNRMIVFGGQTSSGNVNDVWAFSLADSTWTELHPTGNPPPASPLARGAWYAPHSDEMIVLPDTLDAVWALSIGSSPAWRKFAAVDSVPPWRFGEATAYDPIRDRLMLSGGATCIPFCVLYDLWQFDVATSSWTMLPAGTMHGSGQTGTYDRTGDQFVIEGGGPNGGVHLRFEEQVDAYSPASSVWSVLVPRGVDDLVSPRTLVVDEGRGQVRDFEWRGSLRTTPIGGPAAWVTTNVTPARTTPGRPTTLAFDSLGNRFLLADTDGVWQLAIDSPQAWSPLAHGLTNQAAQLTCPADANWDASTLSTLHYVVANPDPIAWNYAYSLTSDRDWPGLPLTGQWAVPASGNRPFDLLVSVPDTALVGTNVLHLSVRPAPLAGPYSTCDVTLSGRYHTVSIALQSVHVDTSRVVLDWQVTGGFAPLGAVMRQDSGGVWAYVGSGLGRNAGVMHFVDNAIAKGTNYAYQLYVEDPTGPVGSDTVQVTVPAGPPPGSVVFALTGARANPSDATLDVAFNLPDGRAARLELLDVTGRRLRTIEVGAMGAGPHTVSLGEGAGLEPGLYLIRLEGGGRRLSRRVVVLR